MWFNLVYSMRTPPDSPSTPHTPCAPTAPQTVRGTPSDVLDVLMNGSVNTSILGPARAVEVLQCVKDGKTTKEVCARLPLACY